MKRSEMKDHIARYLGINFPEYSNDVDLYAESLLDFIEENGMFYCPAEPFGDIGILRQPKGFDEE